MPVLQTSLTPTERPGRVDLNRQRQESEYFNRPETKAAELQQQRQQFMNQPVSGQYIQEGLERTRRGPKAPELRPGDRFQMPGSPEQQTGWAQGFEQQLQSIVNRGQQATEAVRAREAYERQQQLQQLMQRQNLVYQRGTGQIGPIPNYTGNFKTQDLVAKSAPLGMLGPVAPHAERAAREVSGLFGINNIGGYAKSGHIPGSDHYTGRAIDVMLGNKGGYPIVNYMMKNRDRLGVKYIIYNRRYWEPGSGWEPYTGDNPHTGHVHVSFR